MTNTEYKIINVLMDSEIKTGNELADILKISKRAVQYAIACLNKELIFHGGCIVSKTGTGNGYKLEINNKCAFEKYIHDVEDVENMMTLERIDRIRLIMMLFLNQKDFLKIEDISQSLHISERQVSKDLQEVKKKLQNYNIIIRTIPHYGMKTAGSESDKRQVIAEIYLIAVREKNPNVKLLFLDKDAGQSIQKIQLIVSQIIHKDGFKINDFDYQKIIIDIYVTIVRIKNHFEIENGFNNSMKELSSAFMVAKEIIYYIEQEFCISLSCDEVSYITALFESKQMLTVDNSGDIPVEINMLAIEYLNYIDRKYALNLSFDFNLCQMISLHMASLLKRIKHKIKQCNPILDEIKANHSYAFELAQYGAGILNKKWSCILSEDEIGYLALLLEVSLENSCPENVKKILIVCATGRGTSELLRVKFSRYFSQYIRQLDVCSVNELKLRDLDFYDFIFTTVPLKETTTTPIIKISNFILDDELSVINNILKSNSQDILKYFPESLFIGGLKGISKKQVIHDMVGHIRCHKENIPQNFEKEIWHRENVSNTSYGNMTAFPHPFETITSETFVCIAVLENPIQWGDKKVQVVFMASIESKGNKNLKDFYDCISSVITSRQDIQELIKSPTYSTFKKIVLRR